MACCKCCEDKSYQNFNRWTLLVLSIITWVLATVTVSNCRFFNIDNAFADSGFGLFKLEVSDGSCEKYPEDINLTTSHKVGQAFGVLSAITTGFAMIGVILMIFFVERGKGARVVWTVTRVLYILALLFALATFSFLKDCFDIANDDYFDDGTVYCVLGPGGYLNAANFWILLGASITSFCTPVAPKPIVRFYGSHCSDSNKEEISMEETSCGDAQDVEAVGRSGGYVASSPVQRTIEMTPEGKKITEEIVKSDGSRVITETVEKNGF